MNNSAATLYAKFRNRCPVIKNHPYANHIER